MLASALKTCTSTKARSSKIVYKRSQYRQKSFWAKVEMGPPDPILGVNVKFAADPAPLKLNLGVGAYRDDAGKPYILPSVREAEKRVYEAKGNHEYAGISGLPDFNTAAQSLVFGNGSDILKSQQVVTAQALSGTGALRIGTDFLRRFLPENRNVYLPNPTWGNHIPIAKDAGFDVQSYRYYDANTIGLDENGMLADIDAAPTGSIFLFHVCAHNPTGVDPTQEQWKKISEVCKKKGHFIFFDMAYQGFASGDPERDVWPVRHFIAQGHRPIIAQSFAKNFGLYGERIGALHILTDGATESACVDSQLKIIIRPHYSNPPISGARLVSSILSDSELTSQWRKDVKIMADRIIKMRELLVQNLQAAGSTRDWSHVTKQIGMFCYSGLTPEECDELASKFHIYMTRNGRISMAGVTSSTVEYLAKSIAEVTKYK